MATGSVAIGDVSGPGIGHQCQCHRYTSLQRRAQGVDSSWREGNTLLLQYRTKTRQVLRVGVRRVAMTNNLTRQVTRLPDTSANLTAGLGTGDLHADIEYGGLKHTNDDYRVEGSLVVYLAGA